MSDPKFPPSPTAVPVTHEPALRYPPATPGDGSEGSPQGDHAPARNPGGLVPRADPIEPLGDGR
ncbi:MAG TPA: hypothetical protein VK550_11150 [Polyangiaceae bacterium]|nr:hypothetical protein [Polyangiaceae bacterium]